METMEEASRTRGMLVLLRSPRQPMRGGRLSAMEPGLLWFGEALIRGIAILVPTSVLMIALFAADDGASMREVFIILVLSPFAYMFALLPAFTGAVLYLPLVWCAARRWPRAGRAVALACTPLMALGTLPFWEMWRMVETWQMWVPVAAGLLVWAATLRLPALSPAPGAEAGR